MDSIVILTMIQTVTMILCDTDHDTDSDTHINADHNAKHNTNNDTDITLRSKMTQMVSRIDRQKYIIVKRSKWVTEQ